MGKYKILMVQPGALPNTEVEVDGEPVHFPGFEEFTFFSHKTSIEDFWGCWDDHRITELSSGCSIGGGFTPEEALAKAHEQLAKTTPEGLREKINHIIKFKN
jgi:hypothetical protein